jgi:serine/threonine-protein kinase
MNSLTEVATRYRLDQRLGAGGMATVYLALDTVLERRVALKLLAEHLAEDESFVQRFRHEALAAAKLQHPNIVQVFDSGKDEASGRHFIVMEYVDGPACSQLLAERGQLDIEQAVQIICDACNGLNYAHEAGVVHRDVKPGNLLIAAQSGIVKLADFGIAKAAEQTRVTQVGSVLGTAAYLSPEQARGEEAEGPSDIYSLGVCAYQFLTGRLPYEYDNLTELVLKQQNEGIQSVRTFRPEAPEALDRAIHICLSRDPYTRYSSGNEMSEALAAGLQGFDSGATQYLEAGTQALSQTRTRPLTSSQAPTAYARTGVRQEPVTPAAPSPRRKPRRRRRRLAFVAFALAVLLAGAAVALVVSATNHSGQQAQQIMQSNVNDQVRSLEDFIRKHTKAP